MNFVCTPSVIYRDIEVYLEVDSKMQSSIGKGESSDQTFLHCSTEALASAVSGALGKPGEEAAHESQSIFRFAFSLDLIPSNARQECVATVLTICLLSVSAVLLSVSAVLGPRILCVYKSV